VSHDLLRALAIFAAGLAAGTINTVVGSGTLITFPTLLAFGYPPVLANVSNNVGLVPGVASGVYGYRSELGGQRRRLIRLGSASVCGGLVGAILLLTLPQSAFKAIVPALIGVAVVMVVIQPRVAKWVAERQRARAALVTPDGASVDSAASAAASIPADGAAPGSREAIGGPVLWVFVFVAGIYGGYFGAAQGVLLIGMLGIALNDSLQRINGAKNVLAGLVNGVAAVVFILATHIDWGVAGLIAGGSIIGGQIGARIGKRLPPWGLRVVIVCVGIAALVKLLT
jgi:uncharacterized protein